MPKLGKGALNLLQQDFSPENGPQTIEDFIEEGAIEEESGDRWLGSDLAKALRFYQKAFSNYQQATRVQNAENATLQDAYYNALRLLFHVHSQFAKADGVDVSQLKNVSEILTGDDTSVVQDIHHILLAHERSMEVNPGAVPLDLFYNSALVYTEAIEESEDFGEMESMAYKAQAIIKEVLRQQIAEFQEFLVLFLAPATAEVAPEENQEFTSSKTVQPPDIVDSVIAGYGLAQAILEGVEGQAELQSAVSFVAPFVQDLEAVVVEIKSLGDSELVAPVEKDQENEYLLAKACTQALSCSSLEEVYGVWEHARLPEIPQRYMLAADSIETVIERFGSEIDPQDYWGALTRMNNFLKKAQELLGAEQRAKNPNDLGVGALISQLASVYIARSDVDLQRSQLPLEAAQKNLEVLQKNAKAFLKNAMNLAKVSGGIRETALERAHREKRRIEAISRLCVLEGKSTSEELDAIMGQGTWQDDWTQILELWFFQTFLHRLP